MTQFSDLEDAVKRLLDLSGTGAILRLNSNTSERAFEAYLLGLCMKAVRNQRGTAVLTGILSGANPSTLVFRGGPGSMASRAQDFCYVACRLRNKSFEIHLDVEYLGQSGANHEIDVSLYDADAADDVRNKGVMPRTTKPLLMAFECKFYTGNPGVGLARGFVGLINDCAPNKLNGFVANKGSDNLERYLSRSAAPEPFTDLSPLNPDAEDRFVRYVEQVLRKWANSR